MENNIYEKIRNSAISSEAKETANNKKEWEKYLKSFLINYAKEFSTLIKKKDGKIADILGKINLDEVKIDLKDKDIDFIKCLFFLQSGMELFDVKNNDFLINYQNFDSYTKFDKSERASFEKNMKLIEENYDLDGLRELEFSLQFIINFSKDANVRESFFIDYLKNTDNYEPDNYNFLINESTSFNKSSYMSA